MSDQAKSNDSGIKLRTAGARGPLTASPRRHVVVLACMDARLMLNELFGFEVGDAHIIRNAGGIASDDAIRSIIISQRQLGTTDIVIVHHTECGMETFTEEEMKAAIERDTGVRPPFDFAPFADAEADVRTTMKRLQESPFIPHRERIFGYIYDVATGELREVK